MGNSVEFKRESDTSYSVTANNATWGSLMLIDLSGPWGYVPSGMKLYPHWLLTEVVEKLDALNIDHNG
jgi:hypothetical protein